MQRWLEAARACRWQDFAYEEMNKVKLLFLRYVGECLAKREDAEAIRLAEHLELNGGEEQATLFASERMVPAAQAAFGNAMLHISAPLVYPVVLAAIDAQNKGGQELLTALLVGLDAMDQMGDHPQKELFGALLGVAHAYELDEDGWQVLLGATLGRFVQKAQAGEFADDPQRAASEATCFVVESHVPIAGLARGAMAQELVLMATLAQEEWSAAVALRMSWPTEWGTSREQEDSTPRIGSFLQTLELEEGGVLRQFRSQVEGRILAPHVEYYIDTAMALEDVCCMPQFFRK